ncbi:hypothetical protein GUJ93_ZPchr0012g18822 [Zizania palustris]|uniref:Uncharacterized protein n=1 Tax=Zizania palustris TaxID=103762 RepID=A0A8J6BX20_ZIZPA|nr:hypothetical protein GUJ93_ZPchr0012g18822 [Zizania palustris]KAG8095441.1 hypothetical protein GUJ93_ZPchr0012g18822 [Zizania palustris]
MAEAAVVQALIKIGSAFGDAALQPLKDLIKKEVALLIELPELAKCIGRELDMINSFLVQVRTKIHSTENEVLKRWVVRVRKVAYHVEDIMDEYCYNIAKLQEENFISRMMRSANYVATFHDIASGLKEVDTEIKHLSQMKTTYKEFFSELLSNTTDSTQAHLSRDNSLHTVKEGIVGMDVEMELLNLWLGRSDCTRAVMSVWGLFGLGKTTLVRKVYESNRKSFDCVSWIEVPHKYNNDVMLRQLIKDLCQDQSQIAGSIDSMYGSQLVDILCVVLSNKRYLIVLDNVWDAAAFHGISSFLIDNGNASRIIITTRTSDVASLAQDAYRLKLKPLSDKDAMELFCRRAFQNSISMACPPHLEYLCHEIVKKCGGLPSAIYAIGNLLAAREQTEVAWKTMNDQFQCMLEDNPGLGEVRSALSMSILFLPRHLKNCFLYCSLFPQSYPLSRETLVKLWTAEGFIARRGSSTLEEVADEYIMELIRGSLLQLQETDEIGRVAFCNMHDIVRELALSYSRKEMFGLSEDDLQADHQKEDVRRLSISKDNKNVRSSLEFPRLRTFIAFNRAGRPDSLSSLIDKSKYLAVLELQDSPINTIPANIGELFNLHYLGFRRTKVKSLPKSIEKLINLETLDLKYTEVDELPKEICKLKKLRHLFADKLVDHNRRVFRYFKGTPLPHGFSHMEEIQTLETVQATKDSIELLDCLTALRTLWVENVHRADCAKLFTSLSEMKNLSSLLISATNDCEALDFSTFRPSNMKLQKLIVRGCLENNTFDKFVHGSHIKYLSLSSSKNGTDPVPLLAKHMPNLIYLSIRKWCCVDEVALRKDGFPRLKTFFLGDMTQMRTLDIEPSVVGSLEALYLVSLTAMTTVPRGLELIASLRKLVVWGQSDEFKLEWERENWKTKLHHVPEIRV